MVERREELVRVEKYLKSMDSSHANAKSGLAPDGTGPQPAVSDQADEQFDPNNKVPDMPPVEGPGP